VPCNLQPAIAGPNSQTRSLAVLPEHIQEALKPGSHAIGAYEPGQDRKVAAVSNVFMCREDAWVEQVGYGKSLQPGTSEGARQD
jgi:hypothetical protein